MIRRALQTSSKIFDPIRKTWVVSTPEEIVRQKLILNMLSQLGYPKGLLAVEQQIPSIGRRVDLLCYACFKEDLLPLLLVECKAELCTQRALEQILGYNALIAAPFICLASNREVRTFWREKGGIVSVPFLPKFVDLKRRIE